MSVFCSNSSLSTARLSGGSRNVKLTNVAAASSRPSSKSRASRTGRKEGWSSAEVIAAGLATSEQQQAAEQLARGVNYFGTGEFALEDGWSVQVPSDPPRDAWTGQAPAPGKAKHAKAASGTGLAPQQFSPESSGTSMKPGTDGGKSGRQRSKLDPRSNVGSKALAGLAEYMKAKEEEAKQQQAAEAAAAAARTSPSRTTLNRSKKRKQKASSLFGDLPEFDSAYRKASKDYVQGDVVARLPGFDPASGEVFSLGDGEYGQQGFLVDPPRAGGRKLRAGKAGEQRSGRRALEVSLDDLLRQQRGEELEAEEEDDLLPSSSSKADLYSEDDNEEVTLAELREMLSMEDSDVLSGLQDLMPDDDELLALLKPMLPASPSSSAHAGATKPSTARPRPTTRAAALGTYSKAAAPAGPPAATGAAKGSGVVAARAAAVAAAGTPATVATADGSAPVGAGSTVAVAGGVSSSDDGVGPTAAAAPAHVVLRQRKRRVTAPRASRVRRQFDAPAVITEIIEEGEEEEDGAEAVVEESSADQVVGGGANVSKGGAQMAEAQGAMSGSKQETVAGSYTPDSPGALSVSSRSHIPSIRPEASDTATDAIYSAGNPKPASSSSGSLSSETSRSLTQEPEMSAPGVSPLQPVTAPTDSLSMAALLKQAQAGTLDESQLTPLARKLLRYQQQYKQVQEREKQRRLLTQQLAVVEQQKRAAPAPGGRADVGEDVGDIWDTGKVETRGGKQGENAVGAAGVAMPETAMAGTAAEVMKEARPAQPVIGRGERGQAVLEEDPEAKLEAELSRYFGPLKVKQLLQQQRAVDKHNDAITERSSPEWRANRTLHQKLKIVAGKCQGRRIWSSRGPQTRPMMERVRHAVFNMLHSFTGMLPTFDPNMRCLDLFAGTGSVGIEAVSRGCAECHFVEMDPWVVRNVTRKNVDICGLSDQSVFYTAKVEDYLERAIQLPRSHRPFDIISMCPPYLLVSYPQLFDLLEKSPFLHENTFVVVEYPRQLKEQIPDELGPLTTLRDREYGRTWIRMYGPNLDGDDADE